LKIFKPAFFYVGFFVYICIVIKRYMRYLVRYWNGTQIINDLSTNDFSKAIAREFELRKEWGSDNVWMADAVQEILVG